MVRLRTGIAAVSILLATLFATVKAQAQGFFINQQSVRGLGRADAGNVAAANDPGTLFFNPAGMTELWRHEESSRWKGAIHGPVIIPRATLNNAGSTAATPGTGGQPFPIAGPNARNPTDPTVVPSLYVALPFIKPKTSNASQRWYAGFGLSAPFGLSANYPRDWWGRYDSLDVTLKTNNLAPVLAVKIDERLSVGGGIDVQRASSELSSAIPNPLVIGGPTASTDGRTTITGTSWGLGFNVGALLKLGHRELADPSSTSTNPSNPSLHERVRIGFQYRSSMKHNIDGKAVTAGLTDILAPLNGETGAHAELNLPAIVSIGAALEATRKITLYGDYTWFGWSSFDVTRIRFDNGTPDVIRTPNFKNSFGAAGGADFNWTDRLGIRGGFKVDRSPTVDGFRDTAFADDNRFWLAAGTSYELSDRWAFDLAFTHVFVKATGVDIVRTSFEGTPLSSTIRTRGDVHSVVQTIAAGIRFSR